jgi:hypothetical protein
MPSPNLVTFPHERIVSQIHLIRGKKVMFDRDLAALYGVETKVLNQAISRNKDRFPENFMFQLTWEEAEALRSQNVTLNDADSTARPQRAISKRGSNIKYRPRVFTEQGVAMLSAVLRNQQAVAISILIINAFVRMREMLETSQVLRERLAALEEQLGAHNKDIKTIYRVLQRLIVKPPKPQNPMGFKKQ